MVAGGERYFADMERVDGHQGCVYVDVSLGLYRIVGITVVVNRSQSGMDFSSGHQPQPSAYDPVVMPTDGIIYLAPQFVGVSGPVGGITKNPSRILCVVMRPSNQWVLRKVSCRMLRWGPV